MPRNKGKPPYISIITVVYNGEQYLDECIESVENQTYQDYEYIIIDGRSSDNTVEVIKRHDANIDYWISEKDSGIYDAMNKGVQASRGQWIYFLGCDDKLFSPETLKKIAPQLLESKCQLAYGNIKNSNGATVRSKYGHKLLLHNTIHHQSCFYNRGLYNKFQYDSSLKAISDYELNLICHLAKMPGLKLNETIAYCRDGGASTTPQNYPLFIRETNIIRSRHLGNFIGKVLRITFTLKARAHHALRHIQL